MSERLLYVTDLHYQAKGRVYRDEDLFVVDQLRHEFEIALCHPLHAESLMAGFDAVVVRNSGPVIHYADAYASFRRAAVAADVNVYNPLSGKADMIGKQYMVDLYAAGFPVIATVDRADALPALPDSASYIVKPKLGSDSIGMSVVDRAGLATVVFDETLVQPTIEFDYEVSFYFIDQACHYALFAPDPARRWELVPYEPSAADLAFARRFVEWNDIEHGIQRVDACRAASGELLLMELEDLNPYLSLDLLAPDRRDAFVVAMAASVRASIAARRPG